MIFTINSITVILKKILKNSFFQLLEKMHIPNESAIFFAVFGQKILFDTLIGEIQYGFE